MITLTKTPSQGLLFSEPSIAETGVWCELNPDIEPEEWAGLCRYIGNMGQREFKKCIKTIIPSPDSLKSRLRRLFTFNGSNFVGIPVLSIGPSGMEGNFRWRGEGKGDIYCPLFCGLNLVIIGENY